MKKTCDFNSNVEYELFDNHHQIADLRDKLASLYYSPFNDVLLWELYDPSLKSKGYFKLFYHKKGILQHIILFRYSSKKPGKIFVINKQFKISAKDIKNICEILFCEFKKVRQVVFEEMYEFTFQEINRAVFVKVSNDVIIFNMPATMEDYLKSLGASTRKKIKLMQNHIARDLPDLKVRYIEKGDITLEDIKNIASLNWERMKSQGVVSDLDDIEIQVLHEYEFTSDFGFLCVCEIDGKTIAGTINTVIEDHAFMHVIAHDSSYNKYSMGQIALVYATQYLIEQKKINCYHLLCGEQAYKFRHGGINNDLYNVRVFRKHDIFFCFGKTMGFIEKKYRDFRRELKNNKMIYLLYNKFIKK